MSDRRFERSVQAAVLGLALLVGGFIYGWVPPPVDPASNPSMQWCEEVALPRLQEHVEEYGEYPADLRELGIDVPTDVLYHLGASFTVISRRPVTFADSVSYRGRGSWSRYEGSSQPRPDEEEVWFEDVMSYQRERSVFRNEESLRRQRATKAAFLFSSLGLLLPGYSYSEPPPLDPASVLPKDWCMVVALPRLKAHRATTGQYPSTLGAIVPEEEIPRSVVYTLAGEHFRLTVHAQVPRDFADVQVYGDDWRFWWAGEGVGAGW